MEYYIVVYLLVSCAVLYFFRKRYLRITRRATPILLSEISSEEIPKIKWIDCRSYRELENSAIDGTIQIEWNQILNNDLSKNDKIVIFCNSGIRSSQAAEILQNKGFLFVYFFSGNNKEIEKFLNNS